jgi:hypothetical protein
MLKLALKYGLMITIVVIVWVVITHFVFPLAPTSKLNGLAPVIFNVAAIVAIYLAIKARKAEIGELIFKDGIKTGLAVSLVYAVSACIFFFILLLMVGPTLMSNEPMSADLPIWKIALAATAGMFFGSLILGLVYSTIISFFLAKRTHAES